MTIPKDIHSLHESAKLIHASPVTLVRHIKANRLKAFLKAGRYFITQADLMRFAERRAKGLLPKAGRPRKAVKEG
jgi:hypothetical protein